MYEYRAKVLRVVDGDTLHLSVDMGLETTRLLIVRLAGINAPEKNTPEGVVAMDFTRTWCEAHADHDGWVLLRTIKDRREKYGRYLAEILAYDDDDGYSLNDTLVSTGNAVRKVY